MKFTVDRRTWYRGQGSSLSALLRRKDGKKCCLGFVGLQCGLQEQEILDCFSPASVDSRLFPRNFYGDKKIDNAFWIVGAMKLNDSTQIDDVAREQQLIEVFKENGHEIEFIN